MKFGMPNLVECATLRECAELAKREKLDFIEINMSFPEFTPERFDIEGAKKIAKEYDVIIAGSDQVLNPYFLLHGERGLTPTYFLGFRFDGKKIAYAVSFGCTDYPKDAAEPMATSVSILGAL